MVGPVSGSSGGSGGGSSGGSSGGEHLPSTQNIVGSNPT